MSDTMTAEQCLENSCFGYVLNMGDTFAYACADAEAMSDYDWSQIKSVVATFGYDAFNAYAAVKRKTDVVEPRRTDGYRTAKSLIEAILREDEMFMDGDELVMPVNRWRDAKDRGVDAG